MTVEGIFRKSVDEQRRIQDEKAFVEQGPDKAYTAFICTDQAGGFRIEKEVRQTKSV